MHGGDGGKASLPGCPAHYGRGESVPPRVEGRARHERVRLEPLDGVLQRCDRRLLVLGHVVVPADEGAYDSTPVFEHLRERPRRADRAVPGLHRPVGLFLAA